jgi:hypothetical protein
VVAPNPDANALTPVAVEVALQGAARQAIELDTVFGNPAKPLSRQDHLAKFRRNAAAAAMPLAEGAAEKLIEWVDDLEQIGEISDLVDLLVA